MKIKDFLKENYKSVLLNIFLYLIIALIISPTILDRGIGDLDELWNYNFARNIADGLIPYKDFNMIQTPLLPMLAGIVLNIFTNELLTMRILAIILHASIMFMLYKILVKLKINKKVVAIFLIMLFYVIKDYINIDYNYATLFVVLVMIYIELFKYNKNILESNFKKDLLIGLLAGITILLKQSTGIIISIVALFYKIVLIRKKEDLKEFRNILIIRLLLICIPIIMLLIYLLVNNALPDFWDYAILGIATFSNKMSYWGLIESKEIIIKALSILIPGTIVISYLYSSIKNNRKINTIAAYSIGMFSVAFPISDNIHFLIGATPGAILLVYVFNRVVTILKGKSIEETKGKIKVYIKIFLKTFVELWILVYIGINILNTIFYISNYTKEAKDYTQLQHFKYIKMSDGQLELIKNLDEYINSNDEVYILDSDAALYMIPLDRYNKDFDMFLKGNLGSKGEQGQIDKIKNMNVHAKILIKNDNYARNWQNPNEVTNYIKNNLNKIGQIEYFDIYEKID